MDGIVFNASLHRWQFFVTLTFASRDERGNLLAVPSYAERRKMLFAFLRECAKGQKRNKEGIRIQSVPFPALLWLAREERGETGGRFHFHILLDGLPPSRVNKSEGYALKSIWRKLGGGFADVRTYDKRADGVSYVLKGLDEWSRVNANAYEMGKFNADEKDRMLILSNSCARKWCEQVTKTRASSAARSAVITGVRLSAPQTRGNHKRTKETPAELEARIRANWLNAHPAGVSFVR